MSNSVQQAQQFGQSIWYDNIRRGLIASGEFRGFIESGVTGITANPTIFEKAIAGSTDYDEALRALAAGSPFEIYESLAIGDIRAAADLLRPTYERTDGHDGYVSLEVRPELAHHMEATVAEARRLFAALERPNVMIKVPATPEGIPAIRRLVAQGVNINVTLIFSIEVHQQVMEAYIAGLEDLVSAGGDIGKVASVASFFLSRVDTAVDALLEERVRQGERGLSDLLGKTAIANAKLAYQAFKRTFGGERFAALRAKGARVQRPLWASTGTKNPAYSDLHYVEPLIGPDTVNTMPPATLTAFLDHGRAEVTLQRDLESAQQTLQALSAAGVSMEEVTSKLLADGVQAFADSFQKLLANIQDKRNRLSVREHVHPGIHLGSLQLLSVEAALADLQAKEVVARIWRKDHTVWKPDPREITDRLGWLNVTDIMCEQAPQLMAFAREIKSEGYRHVVLLGMGGSSLGPEVFRQTFGSSDGYPELIVLDSTIPAVVNAVTEDIHPRTSLFLVSSKSGGTVETLSLYGYFRALVGQQLGPEEAGSHFVAITDPETDLEELALSEGFRRVFLNPPDIGGRYSVLSYFGLVPAALMGLDLVALLDRADCMREGCASCVPAHENPGAWLGAMMGTAARTGRDKLTILTSPSLASFGPWAEQLVAESTGKEGMGLIPVVGEPVVSPSSYGGDRQFVYLRQQGDDNTALDTAVAALTSAGRQLTRLDLRDRYDLGAEFFRWEFATAIAGALLRIHPFDQPNVQAAKERTDRVLRQYATSGRMPQAETHGSINDLLSHARPGEYLAIMAYLPQAPEVDQALTELRRRVLERYRLATTLGYGPRFLHSTGQLHKGGPNSGLFLQLTCEREQDLPIPGEQYTFGTLADAQAMGDYEALEQRGPRVLRVNLGKDVASAMKELVRGLSQ